MRMFVLVVVTLVFLALAGLEVIATAIPPAAEPLPPSPASSAACDQRSKIMRSRCGARSSASRTVSS